MKKQAVFFWIIIALAIIGIPEALSSTQGLISILIPLILFGLIYVLYKYPPKKYQKTPKIKPSARTAAKLAQQRRTSSMSSNTGKRKSYPFQVIDGNKGKNDEDTPKYH
ncbi:hypothetical protein DCC85_13355 [Paenibacillus sp. CAA11]|uniref:hypothetical protein n=1 Tax=Paenibacillus sp. CAA11 TaxID=1532905 RepID=UPI000D35457B|nr:hypothetical protein [Paenibacillus sp. CAA11]AWB45113.1 hypothetical protein DCC85_13355 [Paenibacillus sp. CAA11]